MYNEVIELGTARIAENSAADQSLEYTFREVFAQTKSVTQNEFYTAAQSGFKPAFKFVIADYYDYNDEEVVKYEGVLYRIIRTYRNGTQLEITVEKRIEGESDG